MINIIKLNLIDNLKSRPYVFQIALSIFIYSIILFNVLPTLLNQNNTDNSFVIGYLLFILNLSIFSMTLSVCIGNISLTEKCNRLEFYLANSVNLKKIHHAYSIVVFILSFISVLLFNLLLCGYVFVNNINVSDFFNLKYILFLTVLGLFCYAASLMINAFILIIKNIQIIKTIIFMTSFLMIFGGVFSTRYLMSLQLNIDISLLTTISLAILIIVMLIIFLFIRKNMVNEKIILSLKE